MRFIPTLFTGFVCGFTLLATFSLAGPVYAVNQSDQAEFREAQRLFDARKFQDAIDYLTSLNVAGKDGIEKYLWLSKVYLETGAGIAAEASLVRARSLGADYAVTAVPFSKSLLVQGKFRAAIEALQGVSIPLDFQEQAYIVSGDANFALKDHAGALRDYNLARAIDDSGFQAFLGLSRLALRDGDLQKAGRLIGEAEKRAAENTMVQYTLGLVARYSGRSADAERYFLESVRLFPENLMANIELATIRINQNRIDEAETFLDLVYAASPQQPMAVYLSGVILAIQEKYNEADILLRRARQITENFLPALYVRGLVSYHLGDNATAIDALERVLRVRPNNRAARLALAATYTNESRPVSALRILLPLIEDVETDDVAALSMAAAAAMKAGDVKRGTELYKRVTLLQPEAGVQALANANAKLAYALFAEGNTEAAVTAISNVTGGLALEIRQLGVLASMQLRNADVVGAIATIDIIVEVAPNRALGYNMRGAVAYRTGRFADAVASYSEALQRNPDYFAALRNRGLAYMRLGNYGRAEADLRRLLVLLPDDARVKAALAKALLTKGEAKEAARYFKEALRDIPGSLLLSADYAVALAESGSTSLAIERARMTAVAGRDAPAVLERMGLLLLELGQPAAAERPLSRHAAYRAQSGTAHLLHGRALLQMGLYTGSKISFDRARNAELDRPDDAVLNWYLFAADVYAEKQSAALSAMEKLDLAKRPDDISIGVIGDLLLNAGEIQKAEEAYRGAYLEVQDPAVVIGLARALSMQARDAEAIEALERHLGAAPDERTVRTELARRYEATGNIQASVKHYRNILQQGAADAPTVARLALLYHQLGTAKGLSVRLAERALLMSPDDPYILDAHGWIMLQAERNLPRAIPSLEKAVRRLPDSAEYKYHLGMAYLAQNRKYEARQLLQQALNLSTDFKGVEEARRQRALLE